MVAEDREDLGVGPLGPANAVLVVVTAVALGAAALLALTHDGGSARTAVNPGTEIEGVQHAVAAREESAAPNSVAARPQLTVYIVNSEAAAAELEQTLRFREMLSFQHPDYAGYGKLEASAVLVAETPDVTEAWKRELDWTAWEGTHVTVHDLTLSGPGN